MTARAELWRLRLADAFAALDRGDPSVTDELLTVDAVIHAGGRTAGKHDVLPALVRDSDDGVRVRASSVVASAEILVLDGEIENPPDDPFHCPPVFTWVGFHDGNRIQRLRFHHPTRAAVPEA